MRRFVASAVVTFVLATLLAIAPASAGTVPVPLALSGTSSKTVPVNVSAVVPLDPVSQAALNVVCAFDPNCPNGIWAVGVDVQDVDLHVTFNQAASLDTTFTDGLLAEGSTLDAVDTIHPITGTLKVTADIHGNAGAYVDGNPFDVDPFTKSLTLANNVLCTVPAPGSAPVPCDLPPADFTILSLPMFPGIGVDLAYRIAPSVVVDSTGFATVRDYKIVSTHDVDPLTFSGDSVGDPFDVPCGVAGQHLSANFSDSALTVDPTMPADLQLVIKYTVVGQTIADTILASKPLGALDFPAAALTDSGPDGGDLGAIAPDVTAPKITGVPSTYSGAEGNPIPMSATVADGCGGDDVVWTFSDGTSQYGPSVVKSFADNGTYSGNVTARDDRGNKTVKNFTVNVTNQAPIANAGPGTTADWGRPVAFGGQALDPGAADLATLQYAWDFGDGAPSAIGAKDAWHTYGTPGSYNAHLAVTDKDGGVGGADRSVTITKRNTDLVYTGVFYGQHNKYVALTATLSDEYGQPVVGRKVTFSIGGVSVDGWTSSAGVATASMKLTQKAGTYTVGATFAEDTHYLASSTPLQTFKVK